MEFGIWGVPRPKSGPGGPATPQTPIFPFSFDLHLDAVGAEKFQIALLINELSGIETIRALLMLRQLPVCVARAVPVAKALDWQKKFEQRGATIRLTMAGP
jgi:hypothetical protein